ncbi:MAG: response regulator [Gammaproteobacteria bacterium]|nr:response regulator [Gammaproteobacteria bacterium]
MTTSVLICDDSSLARKQMARSLPSDWDVDVSFAENGLLGLKALKEGKGEILFLDLNMPEMDGYEVLNAIRENELSTLVVVVSGDIQPEAYQRVISMGALDFVKKPVDARQIQDIFHKYGIYAKPTIDNPVKSREADFEVKYEDGYQEIANVAMGRAADLLARLLNVFVILPIPNVNMFENSELRMALRDIADNDSVSGVCQGFIGSGIAGEALLIFNDSSFEDIAELIKYDGKIDDSVQLELLMDISSILIGACLKGIADQLDVNFSQGHPVVIDRHVKVNDLLNQNVSQWKQTLAIEIAYKIENKRINCELLLLFTEDSIPSLNQRISYIVD